MFANRRFTGLLLVLAGVPIVLLYLWQALVLPLAFGAYLGDFQESYMRAATRLASGQDPYDLCQTIGCLEPTGPQYATPLPLAWMLQPVVGVNPNLLDAAAILFLNASLVVFLFCMLRALRVDDWQLAALVVLMALAFEPTSANIVEGQINLVLLALSGVWLVAWVADRWWGGAALGVAVALKLIQAPVGLLVLWGRRWRMLGAAIVAGLGLWLLAAPQYLLEYLFKVVPAISAGTGFFENHSPGGTIARLLAPDTFFGATLGSPLAARVITALIAVAAIVFTFLVLRSPSRTATARALEAAAVVAVTPIVASYSWGTHLVLLLLPMSVLVVWGVHRRDWTVLGLVALGWALIGPGHHAFQTLLVTGYSNLVVLRLLAEVGVIGISAVWIASLVAVRRERVSERT
ncbi:MAG TPA: glycosyltransferase family 87 protein [Candidatus Dormibacteraeota bacterium]|nr:glycosyltransferase family 87 protein [Candidatus Dormibacteraeota bacterium]